MKLYSCFFSCVEMDVHHKLSQPGFCTHSFGTWSAQTTFFATEIHNWELWSELRSFILLWNLGSTFTCLEEKELPWRRHSLLLSWPRDILCSVNYYIIPTPPWLTIKLGYSKLVRRILFLAKMLASSLSFLPYSYLVVFTLLQFLSEFCIQHLYSVRNLRVSVFVSITVRNPRDCIYCFHFH